MFQNFKLNQLTLLTPFFLAACGGGGGGSNDDGNFTTNIAPAPRVVQIKDWEDYKKIVKTEGKRVYYYIDSPSPVEDFGEEKIGSRDYSLNLNTITEAIQSQVRNVGIGADVFMQIASTLAEGKSFYVYQEDRAQFAKSYIKSLKREAEYAPRPVAKDKISQISGKPQHQELHFVNFTDTSPKWTSDRIRQEFHWDRLERDRVAPTEGLTSSKGVVLNPENLDYLMDPNVKVAVVDTTINPYGGGGDLDYNRVDTWYKDPNRKVVEGKPIFHGDSVLFALMGRGYDNDFKAGGLYSDYFDWHNKDALLFNASFMSNKGKVLFGGIENGNDTEMVAGVSILTDKSFQDKMFGGKYNILNTSWNYNLSTTDEKVKALKAKHPEKSYFEIYKELSMFSDEAPDWVMKLAENDVLWFVSAGNESNATVGKETLYPFTNPKVMGKQIVVGAYDAPEGKLADYSNHCRDSANFCLVAPSGMIYKYADGSYQREGYYLTGTSLASPYAAGVAALVKSVFPWMGAEQLSTTLLSTAKDLGSKGVDSVYGWGLIQPQEAVNGPKRFIFGDFIANLSNNTQNLNVNNRIYRFSNDITGQNGLIVKADKEVNGVLSLSGHNTYKGATRVEDKGILNIDGINENAVEVKQGGALYGSGRIDNLINDGNVFNYSYFKKISPNDTRSQYGMVIQGDYEQTHKGVLSIFLGQPLLVKGFAMLDGWLNVEDVKVGFVSKYGKVFEDVVVAKKGMSGKFQYLTLPEYLTNGEVKYNSLNTGDGALYTASVHADYAGLANTLNRLTKYNEVSAETLENISNLESAINNKVDEKIAQGQTNEQAVNELSEKSSLTTLMGVLQTDPQRAQSILKMLEGKPFKTSYHATTTLNTFNEHNLFKNTLFNDGVYVKSSYSKTLSDIDGSQNYLNIGFNDKLKLNLQAHYGDHKQHDGMYSHRNQGVYASVGYDFGRFGVSAMGGYDRYRSNLTEGKLDTRIVSGGVYANLNFEEGNHSFKPYLGFTAGKGFITADTDGLIKVKKQSRYLPPSLVAGFGYQYEINDWRFGLDYQYKRGLKDANVKLAGKLKDDVLESQVNFEVNKENLHLFKASIEKDFDNWTIGINGGVSHGKQTHSNVGVNLKYTF